MGRSAWSSRAKGRGCTRALHLQRPRSQLHCTACLARRHAARSINQAAAAGRGSSQIWWRRTGPHVVRFGGGRGRPRRVNPPVSDAIFLSMPRRTLLATDLGETIGKCRCVHSCRSCCFLYASLGRRLCGNWQADRTIILLGISRILVIYTSSTLDY